MDLKSELILEDCFHAIKKHHPNLQGADLRLSWWTIVSMLRAVGHVLKYVDSKISELHGKVIHAEFSKVLASKPKPDIFWLFIISERNNFIKEYNYSMCRSIDSTTDVEGREVFLSIGLDDLRGGKITGWSNPTAVVKSVITSGPFAGQNELHVAMQAALWWKSYIENIKRQLV